MLPTWLVRPNFVQGIKAIRAVEDDGYMAGACPKQGIPR